MIVLRFNPHASLIFLRVLLEARYRRNAILVFDPGASITVITPQVAEVLGCELQPSVRDLSIYTAGGVVTASRFHLKSLSLYSETIEAVETLCIPLPRGLGADGLLGLNFLRHFRIGLDFETGTLTFDRIGTAS